MNKAIPETITENKTKISNTWFSSRKTTHKTYFFEEIEQNFVLKEYTEKYIKNYITRKLEKYTVEKWEEIISNLNKYLHQDDDYVEEIIDNYFKAKFTKYTLHHSTRKNILINRMFESGIITDYIA